MRLEGLHHITMITGDAQANVAFYADVLGLRLVKKTVNFDAPEAYHLYFGDEQGSPGSILTWFEFAGATPGRAGAGMVHEIELAVRGAAALDFWAGRLAVRGHATDRVDERRLRFRDPDGLELALVVLDAAVPSLAAEHPDVPAEHAIDGVAGVRAYPRRRAADETPEALATAAEPDRALLVETLGFEEVGPGAYRLAGNGRHVAYAYDRAPAERPVPGAGTVHHIAWHSRDADHEGWRARVGAAGQFVTPIIDRDYFDAIYFRQPQGILFEIATTSPGFAVDEPADRLGEELRLPRQHERLRSVLLQHLTPIENPRAARRTAAGEEVPSA
jgi:glyoxalase family protein